MRKIEEDEESQTVVLIIIMEVIKRFTQKSMLLSAFTPEDMKRFGKLLESRTISS